jgi:hypothetical protein
VSRIPFTVPRKQLTRVQAIERYILLRLRAEEIARFGFLVESFHAGTIQIPEGAPFSQNDLKDAPLP